MEYHLFQFGFTRKYIDIKSTPISLNKFQCKYYSQWFLKNSFASVLPKLPALAHSAQAPFRSFI